MAIFEILDETGNVINTVVAEKDFVEANFQHFREHVAPEEEAPPPEAPLPLMVSPIEFKLLFTSAERVGMKAARPTDAILDDFFDILDDPRLTVVDLGLQSTKDALAHMVAQGYVSADRPPEILAGVVK